MSKSTVASLTSSSGVAVVYRNQNTKKTSIPHNTINKRRRQRQEKSLLDMFQERCTMTVRAEILDRRPELAFKYLVSPGKQWERQTSAFRPYVYTENLFFCLFFWLSWSTASITVPCIRKRNNLSSMWEMHTFAHAYLLYIL